MPPSRQTRLGETGEDLACGELRRRGYAILARRYRTRHGEIDIIARHGEALVFIEVKTRSGGEFGTPIAAVTRTKQRRITRMALDYIARTRLTTVACRFDVVGVLLNDATPTFEIVTDAFGVDW